MQAVDWALGYIGKQDECRWNSSSRRRKAITRQLYTGYKHLWT